MNALRITVAKKIKNRVKARVDANQCINGDCTGEIYCRGLCKTCINSFRYSLLRIRANEGQEKGVEYESERVREGSLLGQQQGREYKREAV